MALDIVFLKSRAGFRGGLEKYTSYLARAFAQNGLSVALLTTGTPPSIEGVNVVSLGPDIAFTWRHILRFNALCKQWILENPCQTIFGMERTTFQTHYRAGNGVHAMYLERRKLIDPFWKRLTFPLNPLHHSLLSIEKKTFESPGLKKLFTNSQMVKEEILKLYRTPQQKIETIHNGVEWKAWESDFEKTFECPRPAGPHRFLFVGNGYQRKGLSFLLQGLGQIRQEDFRLTVIGKDKNVPSFIQMASTLGLKGKIDFLGPQNDTRPFYKEADTLVIPSIYDPFANVTVEALSMGLFIVSSCYNGGKEVLQKDSGIIIEELTAPESVAAALRVAFAKPKNEERALKIRNSIKELDFSNQLDKIVHSTLSSI